MGTSTVINLQYRKVYYGTFSEGVSTITCTTVAICNGGIDSFNCILCTSTIRTVILYVAIEFIAGASQWLLTDISVSTHFQNVFQKDNVRYLVDQEW